MFRDDPDLQAYFRIARIRQSGPALVVQSASVITAGWTLPDDRREAAAIVDGMAFVRRERATTGRLRALRGLVSAV